jgi:hypothetical protein
VLSIEVTLPASRNPSRNPSENDSNSDAERTVPENLPLSGSQKQRDFVRLNVNKQVENSIKTMQPFAPDRHRHQILASQHMSFSNRQQPNNQVADQKDKQGVNE